MLHPGHGLARLHPLASATEPDRGKDTQPPVGWRHNERDRKTGGFARAHLRVALRWAHDTTPSEMERAKSSASSGEPTAVTRTPFNSRFTNLESTWPGPASTNTSKPAPSSTCIERSQRTGETTWRDNPSRSAAGSPTNRPETLATMGNRGSRNSSLANAARIGSTAGCMSGEWNAPATFNRIALTPRLLAASSARSMAATDPDSTTWFAAFSLATRSEEHTSELQSRPHLVC